MKSIKRFLVVGIFVGSSLFSDEQVQPWEVNAYPDEIGYQSRVEPMVGRIADLGFGTRTMASSTCQDTGKRVLTWALEGEQIYSPYTGRAYIQGPTGFFGPKARNEKGQISAFGGDPLKRDLAPAIATLLMDESNFKAKSYLGIPGNLRQQYHFACVNWTRFYPLHAHLMSEDWHRDFRYFVGLYDEASWSSDGVSKPRPLSVSHTLPGEEGMLLGGNPLDGGTENHKTMWRTSALIYAQLFDDDDLISGIKASEVERMVKEMLVDFAKRLLVTGNGEYDSSVYYPHSIKGFLNLYDFSPDEETRELARFILNYFFLTYGVKTVDGWIAGAQKRGYLPRSNISEMEVMMWLLFDETSKSMDKAVSTVHQATTQYRPNKIIWDVVKGNGLSAFELKASRPFYHMDHRDGFSESFYRSKNYAMGDIQMTIVDNPNQQMVWSLVTKGVDGPLAFSGGHPMRRSTSGHSPYTQTAHYKDTLILVTAPTGDIVEGKDKIAPEYSQTNRPNLWYLPKNQQARQFDVINRQKYAQKELSRYASVDVNDAVSIQTMWDTMDSTAMSALYYPRSTKPMLKQDAWYFDLPEVYVVVKLLFGGSELIAPSNDVQKALNSSARRFFEDYGMIVSPGEISGYLVYCAEKVNYPDLAGFIQKTQEMFRNGLSIDKHMGHVTLDRMGTMLEFKYNNTSLRGNLSIDGQSINWDRRIGEMTYVSPYLEIGKGSMSVNNGKEGYKVSFQGNRPVWEALTVE